jgi:hypothetical protein
VSSMAKADVVTLVSDFSGSVTDAVEVGVLYDEVVKELGFVELLTSVEVQNVGAGQDTLEFATDTIRSLEVYSDQVGKLDRTTAHALRAIFGNGWRGLKGTTVAYVQDQENDNTVRLVPIPEGPMSVSVVRVDSREDVPIWLELPIAFEVLNREMGRESNHQDVKFAALSGEVGKLLLSLLGIAFSGPSQGRGR